MKKFLSLAILFISTITIGQSFEWTAGDGIILTNLGNNMINVAAKKPDTINFAKVQNINTISIDGPYKVVRADGKQIGIVSTSPWQKYTNQAILVDSRYVVKIINDNGRQYLFWENK